MRKIILYDGVSLNRDKHVHVFFKSKRAFLSYLNEKAKSIVEFDQQTYKFQDGELRIKTAGSIPLVEQYVTYVIEADFDDSGNVVESGFLACYFVDSYISRSNMIVYQITRDDWGSYIQYAELDDIIVRRCNREIGTGIYEKPLILLNPIEINKAFGNSLNPSTQTDWQIVFVADVTTSSNLLGDNKVTSKFLFRVSPKELLEQVYGETIPSSVDNPLVRACRLIAAAYATPVSNGVDLPVSITGMWIVPTSSNRVDYTTLKTKDPYGSGHEYTFNAYYNYTNFNSVSYNISDYLTDDYQRDNYIMVGTPSTKIPLPRLIKQGKLEVQFRYDPSGVKATLVLGSQSVDVSEDFSFPLLSDATNIDNFRRIFQILNSGLGFLESGIKVALSDKPEKQATGVVGIAQSVISPLATAPKGDLIQSTGNAIKTFQMQRIGTGSYFIDPMENPIGYDAYPSAENEGYRAYADGALFNTNVSALGGLSYVIGCPHLGVPFEGAPTETFIEADAIVKGVPITAENYIKNELSKGIYFTYLN